MKRKLDWFLLGMIAAAGLAWLVPEPGARGGSLHAEVLNKLGVALIFFLHGLTLSLASLRSGALNYRLHLLVQLATFGVFPLLGWAAYAILSSRLDQSFCVGLFFLCALPSTVSSSVALTAAARGNVPAAVFNATLSSLLGVVLTPLWLGVALGTAGQPLPLVKVVLDLVLWLLLPFALGQAFRPFLGALATRHKSKIAVVDRLTILLLVYTSFCDSVLSGVWAGRGLGTVVIGACFSAVLLGIMLTGLSAVARALGLSTADRIAAVFCGSKKTLASGVPMARLIFGAHPGLSLIVLPIMIYHPLQLVVCGALAGRFARRVEDAPTATLAPSSTTAG